MLPELHNFNVSFCSKQYYKNCFVLACSTTTIRVTNNDKPVSSVKNQVDVFSITFVKVNTEWKSTSLCSTNISQQRVALKRSSEKYFHDKNEYFFID